MLLLTRRVGESVLIKDEHGRNICRVTLVSNIRGSKRLGFSAPPHIKIIREELDGLNSNTKPEV